MFPSSPAPGWRSKTEPADAPSYTIDPTTLLLDTTASKPSPSPPKLSPARPTSANWSITTYARLAPDLHNNKVRLDYSYHDTEVQPGNYRGVLEIKVPDDVESSFSQISESGILKYEFDKVFDADATQSTIFEVVAKEKILGAFDGINSTVFAYGQTGSGKTYTIFGGDSFQDRGLIPRSIACLFKEYRAKKNLNFSVRCRVSFTEVYKETVYDLLDQKKKTLHSEGTVYDLPDKSKSVQVLEGENGVILRNVNVFDIESEDDAMKLFFLGSTNRHTAATAVNDKSSRSHAIFTMIVECKGARSNGKTVFTSGKINLVDLAGTGRSSTGGTSPGKEVTEEVKAINLGLYHFDNVISSLRSRSSLDASPSLRDSSSRHVPYRNSMLTSVLRDSLGGNCRSAFILNISSERGSFEETVSTCRFGLSLGKHRTGRWGSQSSHSPSHEGDEADMMLVEIGQVDKLKKQLAAISLQHRTDVASLRSELETTKENMTAALVQRDSRISQLEDLLAQSRSKVSSAGAVGIGRDLVAKKQIEEIDALKKQMMQLEQQASIDRRTMDDLRQQVADTTAAADASKTHWSTVDDLRKQLEGMRLKKMALEDQTKIDHESIRNLRQQVNDLFNQQANNEKEENKRVVDLQQVNGILHRFARDPQIQEDLTRRLVKVALNCWSGEAITHIPEKDLEEARFDEGVGRLYPQLKDFERVCDLAHIRFPVDHIIAKKTELSEEAVTYAFGPDFVAKHHQSPKKSATSLSPTAKKPFLI